MAKWAPYPLLRVGLVFSAGILTYIFSGKNPNFVLPLFVFLLCFYLFFWLRGQSKKSVDLNNIAGLVALLSFFTAGFLLTHYRTAKTDPQNLWHQSQPITYYTGTVDTYISQKPQTIATTLAITKVKTAKGWQAVSGKVRVTINKEAIAQPIQYGSVLLIKGAPPIVKPPLNPNQFDYQQYLAYQQVYHQHYLNKSQFLIIGHQPTNSIVDISIKIRNCLDAQLKQNISSVREYGIATALVLGIKDYLPEDLKTTYTNTGTMHVLAVSGLHVALLFYVLNLFIGKWSQRRGYRIGSFVLMLSIIWLYAFITALSASVLRAVVMFSFILFADTFRRQTNIYNTLAAAALVLLLYNPYFLLDVGFQLSFLAVFGIVYLQPFIYRWLDFNGWLPDNTWKLISTSLAAQLAVLPLSLFYFHQFPVYFLIANLVAIPLSNLALLLGFALLALSWVPVVPAYIGLAIAWSLKLMNYLSGWLLKFPLAVINNITITPTQTWLLYIMLGLLILFFARRRLIYFSSLTITVLLFSGLQLQAASARQHHKYLVFYQASRATALGFISGKQGFLIADSVFYASPKNIQYVVQPHWVQLGITNTYFDTLGTNNFSKKPLAIANLPDQNQLIRWQGKNILVCTAPLRQYSLQNLDLDFLVLANNAYITPENLHNNSGKFTVVLTGANANWYLQKMTAFLNQNNISVHNTREEGALVVPVH